MKNETPSPWSVEADRRFTASPLGAAISGMLQTGSSSQRALSEFVLRDPVFVATHGIEDLARTTGISASTISRYVRDLGLPGWPEFRAGVGETVHSLMAPVAKLGRRMTAAQGESPPGEGAAEASLTAAGLHLAALGDPSTAEAIRAVARGLAGARQVWVMGFGLSAHLAAMLVLGLQPYRDGVVNVVQFGGTEAAAARLMAAGLGDVVIAITFPRYSADGVDLARAAKAAGARLVGLTDSAASPLARLADDLLLAPAQHPVLSSSSLPGLAVIEALVSEFLLLDPRHLERAERLAASLSAYLALD